MSSGLRDLRIWHDSIALGGDVVRAIRPHSRRETRIVSDAIMSTALAVGTHVADGYARYTPVEQRESYMLAKRALMRLESEIAVARHAELIPAGTLSEFPARAAQLTKMLTGFLVYLDRQLAERDPIPRVATETCGTLATPDSVRVPS
jgi:four helix bundle protein